MSQTKFVTILSKISSELRVPILAEGAPLLLEHHEKQVAEIAKSTKGERKLAEISKLLDYEMVRVREGILLKKKYSDVRDIIAVTFAEFYQFLERFLSVVKLYSPPYWENNPIPPGIRAKQEFLRLLTPEQWEKSKTEGLLVAELNPAQSQKLYTILLQSYIGANYTYLENVMDNLRGMQKGRFVLVGDDIQFKSKTQYGAAVVSKMTPSSTYQNPEFDLTFDTQEETVGDLAKRASQSAKRCIYSESLLNKPVILVGGANLSAEKIGLLISKLYNVKFEVGLTEFRILVPSFPRSVASDKYQETLLAVIPDPLRRMLLQPDAVRDNPSLSPALNTLRRRMAIPWRGESVSEGAMHFLYTTLLPRLKQEKSRSIPFANASERQKVALALTVCKSYFGWFAPNLYSVPKYITQFPTLRMICEQYINRKNRPMLSLQMQRWDEQKQCWKMTIGYSDVWDIER